MEEGQEPQGTGEPVTERARIAGVEAGIAAGLVPSTEAVARPRDRAWSTTASASAASDLAAQGPSLARSRRGARLPTSCPTGRTRPPCRYPECCWTSSRRRRLGAGARSPLRPGDRCGASGRRTGTTATPSWPTSPMPGSVSPPTRSRRPTTPSPMTSSTTATRPPGSHRNESRDIAAQAPRAAGRRFIARRAGAACPLSRTYLPARRGRRVVETVDSTTPTRARRRGVRRRRHVARRPRRRTPRSAVAATGPAKAPAGRNPLVATVTGLVLAARPAPVLFRRAAGGPGRGGRGRDARGCGALQLAAARRVPAGDPARPAGRARSDHRRLLQGT